MSLQHGAACSSTWSSATNAGRMAGTQRCEVCDDTNASIRCQECRRNTCEECDEILHLVDANKSHNRVPLFPTRGSQSHNASYASSRNMSPRNSARWSKNDEDFQNFMPRVEASADIDRQIRDLNIGSGSAQVEPFSFASRPADPAPQSKIPGPEAFASRPAAHTAQQSTNSQTLHTTPSKSGQMQAQRPANVPELQSVSAAERPDVVYPERPDAIYSAQRMYPAPENLVSKPKPIPQATPVAQYNPQANVNQQPTTQQVYAPSVQQSNQHRVPTEESSYSQSSIPSQRLASQPAQQHTSRFQHMANQQTPSNHAPSHASALSTPKKQPAQSYGQSASLSSSHHNYSGMSTPSQYGMPVARSHAQSGAATPTVPSINSAQSLNATGGAIPVSRWQERQPNGVPQQQPQLAQQLPPQQEPPMTRSSLDAKQAYLQHMQVLEQHRAVEAHQRMTAFTRQQQYGQTSNQVPQSSGYPQMQMGNMTPSMRHTIGHHSMGNATPSMGHHSMGNATPSMGHYSMGNATPSRGHHTMGNATPSMGNAMGYHSMGNATPSMGQNMGHMTPSSYGYSTSSYGGAASFSQPSHEQRYRFPSQAIVAQAGPNVQTWPHQMRQQQQPSYHQQQQHAQQHAVSHAAASHDAMHARQYQSAYAAPTYAQAPRGYHEPKTPPPERTVVYATASVPRHAYNEPRTPYNEPRSPAVEPVGWPDNYHALAYATAPRSAMPSPAQAMPQRAQPYQGFPAQAQHQQPMMQPMPGSSYSTPSTLMHAKQPSPVDEAETRVRNLIADTERMLAGLSSYS